MPANEGFPHRTGSSLVLLLLAVFVLVLQALMFVYEGNQILRDEERQERLGAALLQTRLVWLDLVDAETGQRGYLITGDEAYLAPYRRGSGDLDQHIRLSAEAVEAAGRNLEPLAKMRPIIRKKMEELAETIRLRRQGRADAAIARLREGDGKRYMDQIRTIIGSELDAMRAERTEINHAVGQRVRKVEAILVSIGAMVILTVGIASVQMVRAVRKSEELARRLQEESTHDGLTGLPNRRMLDHWFDKTLEQAARKSCSAAFLFIDLDGFKRINDELGHEAGDRVLCEASRRFSAVVRSADLLGRLGGDEFAVVVAEVSSLDHLAALARRMLAALEQPIFDEHPQYRIGASIGIALYPLHGADAGTVIRSADTAMYEAKRQGKNRFCFADDTAL